MRAGAGGEAPAEGGGPREEALRGDAAVRERAESAGDEAVGEGGGKEAVEVGLEASPACGDEANDRV